MATYKVIQDVEAEDKLVGPLTLRQFIYAIIAVGCFYLTFLVSSKGAVFLAPLFLAPGLAAGFFAFPWGKDQSTEIWALARIRFLFFPRKRIWNQSGIKDLVTITVPKKPEQVYTDGLSQTEVRSRLSALATTIDSRGWALKDSVLMPTPTMVVEQSSDRLVATANAPREVPTIGAESYVDILNEHDGVSQKFDNMLAQSATQARERATAALRQTTPAAQDGTAPQQAGAPENYWFLNQATAPIEPNSAVFNDAVVHPGEQQAISEDAQAKALEAIINDPSHTPSYLQAETPQLGGMHVVQPLGNNAGNSTQQTVTVSSPTPDDNTAIPPVISPSPIVSSAAVRPVQQQAQDSTVAQDVTPSSQADNQATAAVTEQTPADILKLSQNNDLSIATISHEANKRDDTEVTISLH